MPPDSRDCEMTLQTERFGRLVRRVRHVRLHPFFLDVLTIGVTQLAMMIASLALIGAVSRVMGVMVLGEYLLVKRMSSWFLAASQLGVGVSLPREIARNVQNVEVRGRQLFAVAVSSVLPFIAVVGLVASVNARLLARWCFGSDNSQLLFALLLLLFGSAAHIMVYGYYRGLQRMGMASVVLVVGSSLVPVLAFVATYSSHSAPILIGATGLGMTAVSALWSIPIIGGLRTASFHFVSDARQILRYGLPRVPGEIAFGGTLVLGPMIASHYVPIEQVSFLLLGFTCLTIADLAIAPVGIVLLGKVSWLLGMGRHNDVVEYISHLSSAVLQLSVVMLLQGLIFVRPLILWWLGRSCLDAIPVICIVLLAIPPNMYFVSMRSIVDAASSTAYNARNAMIALAVLAVLLVGAMRFFPPQWIVMGAAAASTASTYVLAFATHRTLSRLKLVHKPGRAGLIWVAPLLGVVSLAAQWAYHFEISKPAFCLVLLVNFGLVLLLTRRTKPDWVVFVWRVAFAGNA